MHRENNLFKPLRFTITTLLILSSISSFFAQVQVSLERSTAIYEAGEWINFSVHSQTSGLVKFKIVHSQTNTSLSQGNLQVEAGQSYDIPFRSTEAGFIQCIVEQNQQEQSATAAVSPFAIDALEREPLDFDFFWSGVKADLAQVQMDAQLVLESSSAYANTYRIDLANIANRRVYGYISIPVGTGPFPAVLRLPEYGDEAGLVQADPSLAEDGNAISMTISIHNAAPDQVDPLAYTPNVLNNRDSIYYKYAITAAMRSIDYIFSRDDFDGESLAIIGVGQGAGLATCVAGIDERVKVLISNAASLGQHSGIQYNRSSGAPNYIANFRDGNNYSPQQEQEIQQALKYYDAIHFAKRFEGASLSYLGYQDQQNPPMTTFAIFNQLQGNKVIGHSHSLAGAHPSFETEKLMFLKQNFSTMTNPPNPDAPDSNGLFKVSAGEDQLIFLPSTAEVIGNATWNGVDVSESAIFSWSLHSSSNPVLFTMPNQQFTQIIFPQFGIYMIRLRAKYQSSLAPEGTVYDGVDYVRIGASIF